MTITKICSLIIFYFLSRMAFAAPCEEFTGYQMKEKLCFDQTVKGWISEKCADTKTKCDAKDFFAEKKKLLPLKV